MFSLLKKMRAAKATKAAQTARKTAWDAHQVALKRGDTRTIHYTRRALVEATSAKLRLEVRG